jgi:hypothetical protein
MDIYLTSIIVFIVLTIVYFTVLKPTLTLDKLPEIDIKTGVVTMDCFNEYKSSIFPKLALYLLAVCLSQFLLNTNYMNTKCGGTSKDNIGIAALYTILPWTVMFGTMLAVLIIFPGFKSAFSDVIGYFVVSSGAKDIFDAIMNTDLQKEVDKAKGSGDQENVDNLEKAVKALTQMVDNNQSILINKMTPDNFADFWSTMRPLMKPTITSTASIEKDYKTQMLNLVVLKDNIGEAIWYVYTALLISSIVYYNLANVGCKKSVEQIKASHDEYVQQQEEASQQAALNNAVQTSLS